MDYRVGLALMAAVFAVGASCVEDPTTVPNSDRGHLFVDLEHALAAGWDSEILIRGPATEGQHCDEELGCYPDHLPIEMKDVTSTDPSVVEVKTFKAQSYGEVEAIRLDLEVGQPGEAVLEFEFSVDGEYEVDEEDPSDSIRDSFGVEARAVSTVALTRMLGEADPQGPYGQCPESALGTYLMSHLDEYVVNVYFEKRDADGNQLRGSGPFPFDVQPQGAMEVGGVDESRHLVELRPRAFGTVTLEPTMPGRAFEAHIASRGDITEMEAQLYLLNEEGRRAGQASALVLDHVYEVDIGPHIPGGGPICGGAMATSVESLSPAICDVVGQVVDTGNPALLAGQIGECHVRMTLEGAAGGQELVETRFLQVQPNW